MRGQCYWFYPIKPNLTIWLIYYQSKPISDSTANKLILLHLQVTRLPKASGKNNMANNISKAFSSMALSRTGTSLTNARLRLFYLMLGANVLKGVIYVCDAQYHHQGNGSFRAIRLMATSALMIVLLRRFPKLIYWGIHYAVIGTILHISYRIFNRSVGADVVTLQAIFMAIISSFYGLGKKWGTIYTILAFAPLFVRHYVSLSFTGLHPLPEVLADLYIAINCLVILMSHIYFHAVLYGNLRESELLSQQMAEAAETKTTFLSTMSHELRTPLNSVIGIAGLLISDTEANPKQKQQLDVLKFSAEALLTLINDILDINKIESGKFELEQAPFNLERLVQGIAQGMRLRAEEKMLILNLEVDASLKGKKFLGDSARLSQILYNLVGNAVKFTEKGRVELRLILIGQEADEYNVRFEVSDTGIGISDSQQKVIFDPFQQASASTTRKFGGTGLGLSIVKKLTEMFGSKIKIKSKLGSGATFYFDLLLKMDERDITALPQADLKFEEHDLGRLKVLLAEDNMMNIFFMKQLFKRWNITADIVENGQEAITCLESTNYDLILMDMHMPIMDGMEAAKRIRQMADPVKANIHIIALTASVSDQIQKRIAVFGINDYLPKPFQLEELRERLIDRLPM